MRVRIVPGDRRASPLDRARLSAEVWRTYVSVRRDLDRMPLPALVAKLAPIDTPSWRPRQAVELSDAVDRLLRVGRHEPTCLVGALVLFRLLRMQGTDADVVIGLPPVARTEEAHAWVECEGRDVGPPPGRGRFRELARFR